MAYKVRYDMILWYDIINENEDVKYITKLLVRRYATGGYNFFSPPRPRHRVQSQPAAVQLEYSSPQWSVHSVALSPQSPASVCHEDPWISSTPPPWCEVSPLAQSQTEVASPG